METLPQEMVAMVAQYLPEKDLASCCAVSPWWREVFGSDVVWRPRCDADSEENLRTTPCRVEPKFTSPEPENSTLSPIGQWRIAYMREKHLRKNWMHGNYVEYKIILGESHHYRQTCFLNNNFVIAVSEGFIKLVDTTVEPPVCVAKCLSASGDNYCEVSVVRRDTFMIWDMKNTVQVIGVDWESYALSVKHTFNVSEGNEISGYEIVNTVFLGLDMNLMLHIWDLEKAIKLKTESWLDGFQLKRDRIGRTFDRMIMEKVYYDKHFENICVIGRYRRYPIFSRYLCMYNLKELRFWPFTKPHCDEISNAAIADHFVALAIDITIEVFNYETSQCLYTFEPKFNSVCTVGNSFMFVEKNKDLVQFSPSTGVVTCVLSHISCFSCYNDNLFIVYPNKKEPQLCRIMPKSTVKPVILKPSDEYEYDFPLTPNQTFSKVIHDYLCAPQKVAAVWTYW